MHCKYSTKWLNTSVTSQDYICLKAQATNLPKWLESFFHFTIPNGWHTILFSAWTDVGSFKNADI